jgi:hypothetical protein
MDCRLSSLDFDIAASAGWYSAIAGLLAGFALLSILFPLDHEASNPDESQSGNAVVVFTCAFVSLLALGFAFAVLAGRVGDGDVIGVAAHEQVVYGSAFGLASVLMLFGLHAVLRTYAPNRSVFAPAQRVIVLTTSVLAPVMLLALQFGSALDVSRFRVATGRADCGWGNLPNSVWIDLVIVSVAFVALVLMWLLRDRMPHRAAAPAIAAKAVLAYTVAVVVWGSMLVPLLPADVVAGFWFEHLALGVTAVATVGVAATAWMGR